jgi:hypothetical protein
MKLQQKKFYRIVSEAKTSSQLKKVGADPTNIYCRNKLARLAMQKLITESNIS